MLKTLFELFITFFKIGAVTFGGGYAMLPFLERELVQKKNWSTSEDLLDYYAISQVTPGVIAVNVSTFVGFKKSGVLGAIFATLGMVTPSLIIISVIAVFIQNFEHIVWVQKALAGINVAVAALLTYAVVNFAKKTIKKWWHALFYLCSFCLMYFLKVNTVIIVVSAAILGVLIAWLSGGLKKVEMVDSKKEDEK